MSPIDLNILNKTEDNFVNQAVNRIDLSVEGMAAKRFSHSSKITENSSLSRYIISDILAFVVGFSSAYLISLIVGNVFFSGGYGNEHIGSFFFLALCAIFWFAHSGLYRVRMPFWQEAQKISASIGAFILIDSFALISAEKAYLLPLVTFGWVFSAFAIVGLRSLSRKLAVAGGKYEIPTVLIGSGEAAKQVLSAIESAPETGYKIVATVKNLPEAFLQAGGSWGKLCENYGAAHVIIALDGKDVQTAEKIIAKLQFEDVSYSVTQPFPGLPVIGLFAQHFLDRDLLLFSCDVASRQPIQQAAKRAIDIIASGAALLLLSPLMLVLTVLAKLDGGPAFFGHKRLGKNGKIFPCLKFRSMVTGGDEILKEYLANNPAAAEEWQATQKLQNDPRVTKLGKILRKTSLDELPQLINVLRGDMSLVGPRPIVNSEVAHYAGNIKYYYSVRPGVTGLWQVSGRNDVSYAQRVQLDSRYVRNWNLWLDISVIFKTFPAVFKSSGAY